MLVAIFLSTETSLVGADTPRIMCRIRLGTLASGLGSECPAERAASQHVWSACGTVRWKWSGFLATGTIQPLTGEASSQGARPRSRVAADAASETQRAIRPNGTHIASIRRMGHPVGHAETCFYSGVCCWACGGQAALCFRNSFCQAAP